MNKETDSNQQQDVLDHETLQLLGSAPKADDNSSDEMAMMRARIMTRVDSENSAQTSSFITSKPNEGTWIEILPNIEKKILHIDSSSNTESYLLRVQPGATAPAHIHERDEHCIMLEGDIEFEDISLSAGDYHFAPKGSRHGISKSITGALLYIQTGLNSNILAPA